MFVIIYAVVASYFAGVMVRLMLTLTPVVCVSAAIAVSTLLDTYIDPTQPPIVQEAVAVANAEDDATPSTPSSKKAKKTPAPSSSGSSVAQLAVTEAINDIVSATSSSSSTSTKKQKQKGVFSNDSRLTVILNTLGLLSFFVFHCTWVTSNAYSSPSVVLASTNSDGSQHIIDDFREAYYWLRQNTPETAVVMSWWDYGYQIAGMADRPTLVDNNTWNNSTSPSSPLLHADLCCIAHIATVGKAMSSTEEVAYPILRKHDVDYVLVIFGGLIGYSGDDINKFLWMVRIAQGVWPDEIQEPNYFTPQGEYRVDDRASVTMKNCLMYKMSYYRFVSPPFLSFCFVDDLV